MFCLCKRSTFFATYSKTPLLAFQLSLLRSISAYSLNCSIKFFNIRFFYHTVYNKVQIGRNTKPNIYNKHNQNIKVSYMFNFSVIVRALNAFEVLILHCKINYVRVPQYFACVSFTSSFLCKV